MGWHTPDHYDCIACYESPRGQAVDVTGHIALRAAESLIAEHGAGEAYCELDFKDGTTMSAALWGLESNPTRADFDGAEIIIGDGAMWCSIETDKGIVDFCEKQRVKARDVIRIELIKV